MEIRDNTFAAACYNDNSIAELEQALIDGPDTADMAAWGLSENEWREQIEQAITEMRAEMA